MNVAEYVINSAQPSDSGTYSCVAQNSAGPAEDRLQLIVSEDGNEISEPDGTGATYVGGTEESPVVNNNNNGTPGPPTRGDIPGTEDNVVQNVKPEEDLVNEIGSRAVLICNAGACFKNFIRARGGV